MRVPRWLKYPDFPGEEQKSQRARVLHATIVSFCAYLLFVEFSLLLGGKIPSANNWIARAFFVLCAASYIGLRKGWVKLIGIGLITTTYTLITMSIINLGTVRAPISSVYYALILIGGLLFDIPGVVTTTVLSSAIIGALIWAQNAGLLPQPDPSVTIVQWVTFVALFITNGGLVMVVLRWTRQSLRRAEAEIEERMRMERELRENKNTLERLNVELQAALAEVKTLRGLIPICSHCKRIRDDKGIWMQIEAYVAKHTEATFTHGVCPDCLSKYYPAVKETQ